jgi:hypothetical protein
MKRITVPLDPKLHVTLLARAKKNRRAVGAEASVIIQACLIDRLLAGEIPQSPPRNTKKH